MLSPNGISLATGSTSAAATFPVRASSRRRPTGNHCNGVLAWHVREGHFGDVRLDGFNLVALGEFEGNLWTGEAKATMGIYMDERANAEQREALQAIFGGQAGGWPAGFAANIGDLRGIEFVPIAFEVAGDLAYWRVDIPGLVVGHAEALGGPTTPPGKRVQTINPPGSEVGPGQVATWGRSVEVRSEGFGLDWTGTARSSKHIPFDWTGPD